MSLLAKIGPDELHWSDDGYAAIGGALLRWSNSLDAEICNWASMFGAADERFPTMIAMEKLAPIAYLKSFPQLATFATSVRRDDDALRGVADAGKPEPGNLEVPQQLLTPAACYHFYHRLAGRELAAPIYLTTRCQCHRREKEYAPLQRQWCFEMREIVCIADAGTVKNFVAQSQDRINALAQRLNIRTQWADATDPFFDPMADPKALAQMLEPVKQELCLDNGLAIASANKHRGFFGECYDISLAGKAANSACVAFGMERWLFAMIETHGPDATRWPAPGAR